MNLHLSTPVLPASGIDLATTFDGRHITLTGVARNRWKIAETIGGLSIGHGEMVTVNQSFAITSTSGIISQGAPWPEMLSRYLDAAA